MSSQTSPATPISVSSRPHITLPKLQDMHAQGQPITMLTCYEATFAQLFDSCSVHTLLVGDSLGMAVQGHTSTLPVRLEDMVYHTRCVAQAKGAAWLIADLPFGSYHTNLEQAIQSSVALMQAGAQMIKLEGGGWTRPLVAALVQRGIPVCAHLGLTPQSVHALGGYKVQGRQDAAASALVQEASALAAAGASMLVLEAVPHSLAQAVRLAVPNLITIGIGAGPDCSGQVLVMHDMLGLTQGRLPRFVRNFGLEFGHPKDAVLAYVDAVTQRTFPEVGVHTY